MRAHGFGLAVLMAAACTTAHSDAIYRWTDEDGHVHYGDHAPGGTDAVVIRAGGATAPRAPAGDDARPRREKQRRLLDAFEKEREERLAKRAQARAERQARDARCAALRAQLEHTREAQYLYREGKGGRRDVLSNEARAEYVAKLEGALGRECE